MTKKILVLMAKEPRAGKVKTRLCPPLSEKQAAELYKCFLLDKIAALDQIRTAKSNIQCALAFAPTRALDFFQRFAPSWLELVPQVGPDLGQRLIGLFGHFFDRGFDQVVVTDSDSPTLPREYLEKSFDLLEHSDLAIGPSEDGGYYLIGLKAKQPMLFRGILWSTDKVFIETINRAEKEKLAVSLLPNWYDVDTPLDLERLRCDLKSQGRKAQDQAQASKRFLGKMVPSSPSRTSCSP